ncbi:MAG TPA: 4-hydroxybenzoate octaprenyltransferase, partial [Candidatus Wallbacteria bacterium]|nr:4-hydroxybenzoate octaprenyltransferase [Candidatus Wallbacteria bacterium]
ALLVYEHYLLKDGSLKNVNTAFFNVNGMVSAAMFLAALINYSI